MARWLGVGTMSAEMIPQELRDLAQWVCWRYETRDDRPTKVPYSAVSGHRAASTDPSTWSTHEAATAAQTAAESRYAGIGYVFSAEDPYLGVDLDDCVDEHGEVHPVAAGIVALLDGYVERSPSGRGLHVIVRAAMPAGARHRTTKTAWGGDFEMYSEARYFTMLGTGSGTIRDAQAEVDAVYAEMFPPAGPLPPLQGHGPDVGDHELLDRAFAARNGPKLRALYAGDTSGHGGDDSAADLALCGALAFWTGPDPDRLDRLVRGSGLMREKWDSQRGESTYGRQTVDRALQGRAEYYPWDQRSCNGSEPHKASDKPLVVWASGVRSASIRWAWTGRLAIGYLAVQTGIEGLGKSVFGAWMLARLTRGELDGEWHGRPVNVLVVSGEDGIGDTWRPRLELAGADLDRTAFLNLDALGAGWDLRDGIEQLAAAVARAQAQVVFVDAALDHMPAPKAGESINNPAFVRQALAPLRALTRERETVTLFSMHPPKSRSGDFRDLVQASQAFTAIPRIGLLFAYHPDDGPENPDRRRVLIRGKGNLGRDPGALEFRVTGALFEHDDGITTDREVVIDVQRSSVTIADLAPGRMVGEREPSKTDRAEALIAEQLADRKWHPADAIRDRLYAEGVNHNSVVDEAKRRLGVQSGKETGVMHGRWGWRIAEESDAGQGSPGEGSTDSWTLAPRARVAFQHTDSWQKDPKNPLGKEESKSQSSVTDSVPAVQESVAPRLRACARHGQSDRVPTIAENVAAWERLKQRASGVSAPPGPDEDALAAEAVRKFGGAQ